MQIHKLKDENGILAEAKKILPIELQDDLLTTLAELEDNDCYVHREWPHCQLHKLDVGKKVKEPVYQCYINQVEGWRLQVQHAADGFIALCNITKGNEHDNVNKIVKSRKNKFK